MNETWTAEHQPEFTKEFFNLGENGSLNIQGITLEKQIESQNHYIYSTSEVFDRKALRDFGYDTCVKIENPDRFFANISKIVRHKATFQGVFKCQYRSRRAHHYLDKGTHPAIIKGPEYKNQREVRAVWNSRKKVIEPIVVECRRAAKYCRLV